MRAFANRFVRKRARSSKLIACPQISRVACCVVREVHREEDLWGRTGSSKQKGGAVCKGGGEDHIPAIVGPVLTGCLSQVLPQILTVQREQDPCNRLPSQPAVWQIACSGSAGKDRIVPPQSGRFFTIMCHRPAGGTAKMAYLVLRGGVNIGLYRLSRGHDCNVDVSRRRMGNSAPASGAKGHVGLAGRVDRRIDGLDCFCGLRALLLCKQHRLAGHRPRRVIAGG